MGESLQGLRDIYSGNSQINALEFFIRIMQAKIATAIPVKVMAVEKKETAGYVDVLPLVSSISGSGETVSPVTLYHLPYSRIQGGIAAVIIDPVVGDIGLAVFAHKDASGVTAGTAAPVPPASYRRHDLSDGFYFGGFLNQKPVCYLELTQDKTAILNAVEGVTINGDVTINGKVTASGDVVGNGHSLSYHTHTGVHGETSTANG